MTTPTSAQSVVFQMKTGDLSPALQAVLYDDDPAYGTPVDLTDAQSVSVTLKAFGATATSLPMTIVGAPINGVVTHAWIAGETDTPGSYRAEIVVTWNDDNQQTFPSSTTLIVEIAQSL